jgi:hypothetical protein
MYGVFRAVGRNARFMDSSFGTSHNAHGVNMRMILEDPLRREMYYTVEDSWVQNSGQFHLSA